MPKGPLAGSRSVPPNIPGEFKFIQKIQERFGTSGFPVLQGIGDDAAILRPTGNNDLLVSTDLLIEGVHFTRELHSFEEIGYRAAAANLSDIAAMGGTPQAFLVGITIPPGIGVRDLTRLYQGLMAPCQKHKVVLIGGDTSRSPSSLCLCITVLGKIRRGGSLTRSGAKVSDHIYVTGTLGDSSVGLRILQQRKVLNRRRKNKKNEAFLIKRHLRPTPRITVGQMLAKHKIAHSAIDLSDGLSGDLTHLCDASQVGAELWADSIPISPECREYGLNLGEFPLDLAMRGGEDYELLFTAPAKHRRRIEAISKSCKVAISCVGKIHPQEMGIMLKLTNRLSRKVIVTSYNHFSEFSSLP